MLSAFLSLVLGASRPAVAAFPEAEPSAAHRKQLLDDYLHSMRQLKLPEDEIGALEERLRRDPKDAGARARLTEIVRSAQQTYDRQVQPLSAPFAARERDKMVDASYESLLQAQRGDFVADEFLGAVKDYRAHRLLSSFDRLETLRRLGIAPAWMKQEIARYQREVLPAAAEQAAAGMREPLRSRYRDACRALMAGRWDAAIEAARVFEEAVRRSRRTLGDDAAENARMELRDLAADLRRRAKIRTVSAGQIVTLEEQTLELAQRSPASALTVLRTLVYRDGLSRDSTERVRAGLLWAYSQTFVEDTLAEMKAAYDDSRTDQVYQLAASVLTQDPDNPAALRFLARLEKDQAAAQVAIKRAAEMEKEARTAEAALAAQATAPKAEPKTAPVREIVVVKAAERRRPSHMETIMAQARYQRGYMAYARDDKREALVEWQEAVRLDPGNDKAKNALSHLRAELGLAPGESEP